jgi:hypothetical protein
MYSKFLTTVSIFALVAPSVFSANAVSVSQIQGLDPARGLMIDVPIRYVIQFQVGDLALLASSNIFTMFSPDGATWQPVTGHDIIFLENIYDGNHGYGWNSYIPDGDEISDGGVTGSDTLAFAGFQTNAPGFPPNFSGEVFYFETKLTEDQIGKSICLDSIDVAGFNSWDWLLYSGTVLTCPSWGGPICYEIVDCCVGNRDDLNGDGLGPNILDLTRLVDFQFRGGVAPVCNNESDLNSDGLDHNILDLAFIVDRIFRGGPAPGPCPFN